MFKYAVFAIFLFVSAEGISADASPVAVAKKLVGFIRYKKNDNAIKLIDTKTFSKNLLPNDYDKLSENEKSRFETAVKGFIVAKSFPIALKYFDKIDINYENPVVEGSTAKVPSSILYKGSENIKFSWILTKNGNDFLVSDFLSDGKLATEVNSKKIEPLYKKKGIDEVILAIEKASK